VLNRLREQLFGGVLVSGFGRFYWISYCCVCCSIRQLVNQEPFSFPWLAISLSVNNPDITTGYRPSHAKPLRETCQKRPDRAQEEDISRCSSWALAAVGETEAAISKQMRHSRILDQRWKRCQ